MKIFDDIMNELREEIEFMFFSEIIREARARIGLMQYRAAEIMGMKNNRLKNLETGYFRVPPTWAEIEALAEFYEIDKKILIKKSQQHVDYLKLQYKNKKNDKNSQMQLMQN